MTGAGPFVLSRRGWLMTMPLLALAACRASDENARAVTAAEGQGDVVIGLVWSGRLGGLFQEGAELARDEINAQGGVLGRPIRFVVADDFADADDGPAVGRSVARAFAEDPELIAVVGHSSAATAVPASITYQDSGILFINPSIPARQVNQHNFQMVFSTIPNDLQFSTDVATFASGNGYRRVGVLNTREDWAGQSANAFIKHATTLGMTIVTRRSFNHQRDNFRDVLADLGASQFDVIFLAADERVAALIVNQSMEMNLDAPFLMSDLIDIHRLKAAVGDSTPMVAVPILFNPFAPQPAVHSFNQRFKTRYDQYPDGWAAQAYDAVRMLAYAMEQARSRVPLSVATMLRYTLSWRGVTGRHSFNRGGSVYTKVLEFATLQKGKIEYHSSEGGITEDRQSDL